ncbi:MAG: hypothetical protein ACYTG7_18855, partial [Planctomycetota bacterium]
MSIRFNLIFMLAALCSMLAFWSCGGGGGSSGSGVAFSGDGSSISLVSITFPESIDLGSSHENPPPSAPLTQQVVFTFSGPVAGEVTESAISISATPTTVYNGPTILYDPDKNLVRAQGEFAVFSNVVVFTPRIPTKEVDLSMNAEAEEVPGLIPEMTYQVFVPVGTSGSIPNLTSVQAGVKNPVSFTTGKIEQLYFANFPYEPSITVGTDPVNGSDDFPVNTLGKISGKKNLKWLTVTLDGALSPNENNLFGFDSNNDNLHEPNFFLRYFDPLLYVADLTSRGMFRLDLDDPESGAVGEELPIEYEGENIALEALCFDHAGRMSGLSEGRIFKVAYDTELHPVELTLRYDTENPNLRELALAPGGLFYAIDTQEEMLVRLNAKKKTVESVAALSW